MVDAELVVSRGVLVVEIGLGVVEIGLVVVEIGLDDVELGWAVVAGFIVVETGLEVDDVMLFDGVNVVGLGVTVPPFTYW